MHTLDVPSAGAGAAGVELLSVTFDFGVRLDAPVFAVLNDEERALAAHFIRHEDAIGYAATRAALRHALAARVGLPAFQLRFERDSAGRPRLAPTQSAAVAKIDFNVSHSKQHALIALSAERRVGVDIEIRDADLNWQTLANVALAGSEEVRIATLPAHLQLDAFYDVWTAKEALLKALGIGITGEMTWFSVLGKLSGEPMVRLVDERATGADGLTEFDAVWCKVRDGYAACLAWSRETGDQVRMSATSRVISSA
ncbi:4'-phosphopantetheinyl transferase [Paraburkholderia sp. Clong3]|uniref:4'-phosphopantetheinyl transferase family protein n=1 Tax=Paraburkholderia sp. Clong3 TaxID=2991061 RepID=UPI003D23A4E4